jgi:predicted nucleotidyltransferase
MSNDGVVQHRYLDAVVRRIVEVAKPDRIILFGSAARGEGNPDSDLDFLVVKSGVPHRRRLAQQVYRALFGIPVPVDVPVVTPEDIEAFRGKVGTVIGPALAEGREVYAAPSACRAVPGSCLLGRVC